MEQKSPIETFIFIDLESTGLPQMQRKVKMVELSAISVCRKTLLGTKTKNCIPRIMNKIGFVVNPYSLIPDDVVDITGLDNFMVEHLKPFDENMSKMLKNFIKSCAEPVCLVAHNGARFDFPLLKKELKHFPGTIADTVLCVDSLGAFRNISKSAPKDGQFNPLITTTDLLLFESVMEMEKKIENDADYNPNYWQQMNEVTPEAQIIGQKCSSNLQVTPVSVAKKNGLNNKAKRKLFAETSPSKLRQNFTLSQIYRTLFDEPISREHQAEGDAIALLKCVVKLGAPVLEYFDCNANPFVNVKELY